MPARPTNLYHALIRTHHITSRKKVTKIKKAAAKHTDYVLIRSGGSPGIMYCEGSEEGVNEWVSNVQNLRYKDYQCIRKPAALDQATLTQVKSSPRGGFEEIESVTEFKDKMISFGLLDWWRTAMGYEASDDKISGSG